MIVASRRTWVAEWTSVTAVRPTGRARGSTPRRARQDRRGPEIWGANMYGIEEYNDMWTIIASQASDLEDAREKEARREDVLGAIAKRVAS